MRKLKFCVNLLLLVSFVSCVSPFDQSATFTELIVIQGLITDQPGPYLVSITKSKPLDVVKQVDSTEMVRNAYVTIEDNEGNSETLIETSAGIYSTQAIQGTLGRAYSIKVKTREGWEYRSLPDTLLPVGDFELYYRFQLNEPPATNRQIKSKNGFNVYLNGDVLPEQRKRVWWRWTGTFEYVTYPERRTYLCCSGAFDSKDPVKCSGFVAADSFYCSPGAWPCWKALRKIGPCECCTCWANQYNQFPLISDPRFINNGKVNDFFLGFIETNATTFSKRYHFKAEQFSLSATMFEFWKKIQIQESNSSNLFQTIPPKSRGNIAKVSEKGIDVVGYFAASSVKTHSFDLFQSDVPYIIFPMDTVAESCTSLFRSTTTKKPPFW